ncbi:MAG: HTH-type transcriptional repressor CarH [Prosthecobacter sp.]|nr:HTH-type transcriptional repressor CarH [Prosthecobacter sp.]
MPFPIQTASQLSGLSPHVIRIWERRYNALNPSRTCTNRRMYCEEAIERLRLLRELTEAGHRIGSVARLCTDDLRKLANQHLARSGPPVPPAQASRAEAPALDSPEDFVKLAIEASKVYDSERLSRLLQRARQQFGQRGMLHHVICPLIVHIGEEWQTGNLRPAHEHVATSVIRELLMTPVPGSQTAPNAPEIVITTPAGEMHELGAMMAAATARDLGWKVTYLGPNLPIEEIAACAVARKARAVALSVVYPEKCPVIEDKLRRMRLLLPEYVTLLVGGRAARGYQDKLSDLSIEWAHSLCELDRILVRVAQL